MKDNATLEDVLSALQQSKYLEDKEIEFDLYSYKTNEFRIFIENINSTDIIYWQLNKPFSEQSEETKQTLNKIL